LGASSGESENENDLGSRDSDDFSYGGGGDYDNEVAAANARANEPVDAESNEELLGVAAVARSPVPNFIGDRPTNVVTTVSRRGGRAGQGGQGDSRGAPGVSTVEGGRGDGQGDGSVSQASGRGTVPRRSPSSFASSRGGGAKSRKTPPIVSEGQSLKRSTGWQNQLQREELRKTAA
jgi:hypothetical protein